MAKESKYIKTEVSHVAGAESAAKLDQKRKERTTSERTEE
jgi:hypothetical protein